MKKYELTKNTKICFGHRLFQIRAITCFDNILAGQFGGYIEKEENLSHDGNAWVYDNACIHDYTSIYNNAKIYDNAEIFGNTKIYNNAYIYGNACIYNNTLIYNNIEE